MLFAAAAASLVAMPLAGACIARFGSRTLCRVLAFVAAAAIVPPFAAARDAALIAAAALLGASFGALDVAMNAQAVVVQERAAGPIMSSFHAAFSIGGLAGAGISAVLLAHGGTPLHDAALVGALLALAALAAFPSLALDPPQPAPARGVRSARRFARAVGPLGLLALCGLLAEGAVADWSGVYLRTSLGTSVASATFGFAAFSVTMTLGRLAGDVVVARLGARVTVAGGALLAAAALAAALVAHTVWPAYLAFGAVGLGLANVVPVLFAAAGKLRGAPPGAGIAGVSTLGYAGLLLGPPAIGFAADALGLRVALAIVVVAVGAVVVLAPRIIDDPRA